MSGNAQAVLEIDDRIACAACVIETGPPVTVAAPMDSFSFLNSLMLSVARDSEGNHIVGPVTGDAVVAVFGPDGRYRSSYGQIGGGPGEFAIPFLLWIEVGDDDILYAIDPVTVHTLAPRAETSLRSVRMPVQASDAVVLRDGRVAVQATVRTEAGNTTVQLLRPDGTIEASIGASERSAEPSPLDLVRVLGRSNDRVDVWSGYANRYRVIRYGLDGQEKSRLERVSEWFRPYSDGKLGAPFLAPADPRIASIHQDADGLLWVAIERAPPSFSPLGGEGGASEGRLDPNLDVNRFLHTTIEVLDPVAGELVTRREFDEYVRFVSTPGDDPFVYTFRPDAFGDLVCIVTPLKLREG